MAGRSFNKTLVANAILAAVALLLVEGLSFAAVRYVFLPRHPEYFAVDFMQAVAKIADHEIESYARTFHDPVLGWRFREGVRREGLANSVGGTWMMSVDETGARSNPLAAGPRGTLAVYGDSYAFGDEVDDDKAWSAYLSALAGMHVENFGIGAQAPDQGVLRFERQLADGYRPKIAILAVHTENIKNILSAYRKFYFPGDGHVLGFKPVLAQNGGKWDWVLPRLTRPTDRADIAQAARWAGAHDYFYQLNESMPVDSFPYSVAAFRYAVYAFRVQILGQNEARRYAGDSRLLWSYPAAAARMEAIFDRFVALAQKNGVRPVALFIPEGPDLKAYVENGVPPPYAALRRALESRYGGVLVSVDVAERPMDAARFNLGPYYAHASTYGNRVIASAVFEALANRQLVPNAQSTQDGAEERGVAAALGRFAGCPRLPDTPSDGELLGLAKYENAALRADGADWAVVASNDDPIVFLEATVPPPERVRISITPPQPTVLEVFVITDRGGYTEKPYRVELSAGRNDIEIAIFEREAFRLRIDPGSAPGPYRIHKISFHAGCRG